MQLRALRIAKSKFLILHLSGQFPNSKIESIAWHRRTSVVSHVAHVPFVSHLLHTCPLRRFSDVPGTPYIVCSSVVQLGDQQQCSLPILRPAAFLISTDMLIDHLMLTQLTSSATQAHEPTSTTRHRMTHAVS